MVKRKQQSRDLFAASTSGLHIRICERLPDDSRRAMMWGKLTRAERRRGEELVRLSAPDPHALACDGTCAWKAPIARRLKK
jgi:hypothetical protein